MTDHRPDTENTVELLQRAGAGDRAALNQLLAEHRDELRAFVASRLDPGIRTRVDPSDVVQEALTRVAHRLPDFLRRQPMPFHVWVRKEAYELALNHRRQHRADRRDVGREAARPDNSSMALIHSLVAACPTPSEEAQANELAQRITEIVKNLDEADREILLLRQVDQLPYDEVAVLLEVTPATARQRYGRALLNLKDELERQGLTGKGVA